MTVEEIPLESEFESSIGSEEKSGEVVALPLEELEGIPLPTDIVLSGVVALPLEGVEEIL